MSRVRNRKNDPHSVAVTEGSSSSHMLKSQKVIQKLEERLHFLELAFKQVPSPALIFAVDKNSQIQVINEACAKIKGRSAEESIGMQSYEFWQTRGTKETLVEYAMRTNTRVLNEIRLMPKGALNVPTVCSALPLYDDDGSIIGGVESIVELENFHELLDMTSPLIVVDKELKIGFINKAAADLVGLPPSECLGKRCYDLFNTPLCKTGECVLVKAMRNKSLASCETEFKKNGKTVYLWHAASPIILKNGSIVGAVLSLMDTTELRAREQALGRIVAYLKKFVQESSAKMRSMAEGDLTVRLDTELLAEVGEELASNVELLVNSFNTALSRIVERFSDVISSFNSVTDRVNEAIPAIEQLRSGMQQVSNVAQQVASSSSSLANLASSAAKDVQSVKETLESVREAALALAKFTEESKANTDRIIEQVKDTLKNMERIFSLVSRAVSILSELNASAGEIGKVTDTIRDIADKTHLLAINAAIEAARAGEHGRGFAVVADEVRKLAEESKRSTEQIGNVVRSVLSKVNEVSQAIDSVKAAAEKTGEMASETISNVEILTTAVDKLSTMSHDLTNRMEKGMASVASFAEVVEQVASTSEEYASASEELSAAVEEQTAAVESLYSSTVDMKKLAEEASAKISESFILPS